MAKSGVEGVIQFNTNLGTIANRAKKGDVAVIVGYTQNYAVYVHEDLQATHAPGKQAKYLEQPLVDNSKTLQTIIAEVFVRTDNMELSLLTAGMRLQRESQKIVPIDTGALRGSAFTRKET